MEGRPEEEANVEHAAPCQLETEFAYLYHQGPLSVPRRQWGVFRWGQLLPWAPSVLFLSDSHSIYQGLSPFLGAGWGTVQFPVLGSISSSSALRTWQSHAQRPWPLRLRQACPVLPCCLRNPWGTLSFWALLSLVSCHTSHDFNLPFLSFPLLSFLLQVSAVNGKGSGNWSDGVREPTRSFWSLLGVWG